MTYAADVAAAAANRDTIFASPGVTADALRRATMTYHQKCALSAIANSLSPSASLAALAEFGGSLYSSVDFWFTVPDDILPSFDLDFQRNRAFDGTNANTLANLLTVTRATPPLAYMDDASGNWATFAPNTLRISNKGLLVEESRINIVLGSRDLTNLAWVSSGALVAKDQVGIDGVANSASSVKAYPSGNATVLQSITTGSTGRFMSAFVKRIAGSGTINMTMDNGSTWTAIDSLINSATWTRVTIPTQTLANPTVGFQIVTAGDKIAVDFVQNEAGSFATSPILTTTVAVTRAADVVTVTAPPTAGSACTLFGRGTPIAPTAYATDQHLLAIDDGTTSNRLTLARLASTGNAGFFDSGSSGGTPTIATAWAQNASGKLALAYQTSDQAASFNDAAVVTASTAGTPTTYANIQIGSDASGASFFDGYVERVALWASTRLLNATLRSITA